MAGDGDTVASGDSGGTIILWVLSTGERTAVLKGHTGYVYGLALRGGLLVSGGGYLDNTVRLWREASCVAVLREHTSTVFSIALGSGARGEVAVSASYAKPVKVWSLDEGTASLATLRHPKAVYSVSAERDVLATACADGKVRTYSLVTLECTRTFEAHDGRIAIVWTVRLLGGVLVSGGGSDKRVKVWELEDGGAACVATLEHEARGYGVAVLPSGAGAAGGDKDQGGGVLVWRPTQ